MFISKIQLSKEFIAVREVGEEVLARLVLEISDDLDYYYRVSYGLVDCFDVPESPLGYPGVNSVASCVYLKTRYGVCCIAHVRLYDVNSVALHSLAKAVEVFRVDGIVLTMGDKPKVGFSVDELDTVSAIDSLRKSGYRIRIGAILSLRYGLEDIINRLRIGADFFLVLRLGMETLDKYRKIYQCARDLGKELYPYIIVATDSNRKLLTRIDQPYVEVDEISDFISEIKDYADGVILSVPKEKKRLREILEIAKEALSQ